MKGKSPTARSLAKLRGEGYLCAVTERWNQYAKVRVDLFGFIDVLAIRGVEVLAVQATSGDNVSARVQKILSLSNAQVWLASPNRQIVVHGWRKVGPRGCKVKKWECRVVAVTTGMLNIGPEIPPGETLELPLVECGLVPVIVPEAAPKEFGDY